MKKACSYQPSLVEMVQKQTEKRELKEKKETLEKQLKEIELQAQSKDNAKEESHKRKFRKAFPKKFVESDDEKMPELDEPAAPAKKKKERKEKGFTAEEAIVFL